MGMRVGGGNFTETSGTSRIFAETVAKARMWFGLSILAGSAILKGVSLSGNAPVLAALDPVFGISNRQVMWLAIGADALACAAFFWRRDWQWRAVLLLTVGAEFLAYHAALLASGFRGGCPCLGRVWKWAGVADSTALAAARGLAFYIFAAGLLAWLIFRRQEKQV